jgi:hypothetical protein
MARHFMNVAVLTVFFIGCGEIENPRHTVQKAVDGSVTKQIELIKDARRTGDNTKQEAAIQRLKEVMATHDKAFSAVMDLLGISRGGPSTADKETWIAALYALGQTYDIFLDDAPSHELIYKHVKDSKDPELVAEYNIALKNWTGRHGLEYRPLTLDE